MSAVKSAVLFLVFNRPDTTREVFEAIRAARPSRLYIAADGPRKHKPEESLLCEETRAITEQIDWPCSVKTLFRNENIGCRMAISSAIDWFFEQEEEGIILEDDCLPHPSFFSYCDTLLEKYRNETRIMHISGDNFGFQKKALQQDYYFSNIAHIWGWATWRRAWKSYDVSLNRYLDFRSKQKIRSVFPQKLHQQYWNIVFDQVYSGKTDTWDYQWNFCLWANQGLAVIPAKNLVSNIGFESGTHAHDAIQHYNRLPAHALSIHSHPAEIAADVEADEIGMKEMFRVSYPIYIRNKIRKLFHV